MTCQCSIVCLGLSIFDIFDYVSSKICLPVGGMLISIFTGWYLNKKLVMDELTNNGSLKAPYFNALIFTLKYLAPIAIACVFLNELGLSRFIERLF